MSEYVESEPEISSVTEHLAEKNHWSYFYSQILYQEVQSSLRWQLHKLSGSNNNKWFSILFIISQISSSYQST